MGWQNIHGEVRVERSDDGEMAFVFPRKFVDKFDKVFKNQRVNIFVVLAEADKKMIVQVAVAKREDCVV